jgi:hypothetical protein
MEIAFKVTVRMITLSPMELAEAQSAPARSAFRGTLCTFLLGC